MTPATVKFSTQRRAVLAGVYAALIVAMLAIGVASSAESAASNGGRTDPAVRSRHMQFTLTEQLSPAGAAAVTATPTPRVILIQPTPTPSTAPTATPAPNRAALPTATAPVITVETATVPRSTPVPTATPLPTVPPTPTTTPLPTSTPTPSPPQAAPTLAPSPDVRLSFAAEDWTGGYYRGDSLAYGRPWVAIYGALSAYPTATLTFALDATPGRPATLSVTGLDDEWSELNPIAVEVNGEPVYSGPSPFLNWDGVGSGENAAWTTAPFTIPSGLLRAGSNEISVANLSPSASFDAPPYVLLADAILEISARSGGEAAASSTPTPVPIVPSASSAAFTAEDWVGAVYRGDSQFYGRPWSAIYGAASDYPRATLRFRLDGVPTAPATLTVLGLDDELGALNPIAIEINDREIFSGASPFLNWDGIGNGEDAVWTEVAISIPVDLLRQGRNEFTVANLSPSANFSAPPYVLLADATLDAPGARVVALAPDESRRQRDRDNDDDAADDD